MTEIPQPRTLGSTDTCANCAFWDPQDEEVTRGLCRRQSPAAPAAQGGWGIWPACHANDWCGDWTAAV